MPGDAGDLGVGTHLNGQRLCHCRHGALPCRVRCASSVLHDAGPRDQTAGGRRPDTHAHALVDNYCRVGGHSRLSRRYGSLLSAVPYIPRRAHPGVQLVHRRIPVARLPARLHHLASGHGGVVRCRLPTAAHGPNRAGNGALLHDAAYRRVPVGHTPECRGGEQVNQLRAARRVPRPRRRVSFRQLPGVSCVQTPQPLYRGKLGRAQGVRLAVIGRYQSVRGRPSLRPRTSTRSARCQLQH